MIGDGRPFVRGTTGVSRRPRHPGRPRRRWRVCRRRCLWRPCWRWRPSPDARARTRGQGSRRCHLPREHPSEKSAASPGRRTSQTAGSRVPGSPAPARGRRHRVPPRARRTSRTSRCGPSPAPLTRGRGRRAAVRTGISRGISTRRPPRCPSPGTSSASPTSTGHWSAP